MTDLQQRRKRSGMSQFLLARSSGVSRTRLSLAETGQVSLSEDEEAVVRRALDQDIQAKVREISLLREERRASA